MVTLTSREGERVGDAAEVEAPRPSRRFDVDLVVLATAAVVLLVPLAAVLSALRNPWIGLGDWVRLEQNVRDVGGGDTPLVGAWSRFGWDHPGPWPFYLMAPFYRIAGAERGLLFSTAMVNLLLVAGFVAVVLRYPRTRALVALAGMAVLLRGLGVAFLLDPWNPWMAILPFALFLLLAVEVATGRRGWVMAAAAGAGSLAMQAHLGLVPPVGLIGAVALVLHVRSVRGEGLDWRRIVVGSQAATVVLVVAWLPVVADQLWGRGNLGKLARWVSGEELVPPTVMDEGGVPTREIPRYTAWLLDPIGLWAGRFSAPTWGFFQGFGEMGVWRLLLLAALPVASVVLWRRHRDSERAGAALVAAALGLAGVVGTVLALVTWRGVPFLWGVRWVAPVVMLLWIGAGWAVSAEAVRRWPWLDGRVRGRRLAIVVVVAIAVVAAPVGLALGRGSLGDVPGKTDSELWQDFGPEALAVIENEPLVVLDTRPMTTGEETAVLQLYLDRNGIDWIDSEDPAAAGHPTFYVQRLPADDNGQVDEPLYVAARAEKLTTGPGGFLSLMVLMREPPR